MSFGLMSNSSQLNVAFGLYVVWLNVVRLTVLRVNVVRHTVGVSTTLLAIFAE